VLKPARWLLPTAILALAWVGCAGPEPPSRAFSDLEAFERLPPPGPFDWRALFPEKGQTFEEFVRVRPNRLTDRRKIYLQPLGAFPPGESPSLLDLQRFATAFFDLEVRLLPPVDVADLSVTSRYDPRIHRRQLLTKDLRAWLAGHCPADAAAFLGITMEDLYPGPDWNYVFGEASSRVGIYSWTRFDPQFFGGPRPPGWQRLMLLRSCKVLAHETAHMLGLPHCTFYRCVMNGGNSLEENDAAPLQLCPVDLHKLHHRIGFDVLERYRRLLQFSQDAGFDDDARWIKARLTRLDG
jgi:archaemetzincin